MNYDPKSQQWKGPIVEAPFNDWNIDGACPHFQANGERLIWAAGYDRGPDIVDEYREQGKPTPVMISLGGDPLLPLLGRLDDDREGEALEQVVFALEIHEQ